MKRKLTAFSAIAALAAFAAFGQAEDVELNETVYQQGLTQLVADGYDVIQVDQDESGTMSFSAHNGREGRMLILDANGMLISDGPAEVKTGEDVYAAAQPRLSDALAEGDLATSEAKDDAVDPKTALEAPHGPGADALK
ncbi:hypothetical protein [Maritimibacter sp. UBA3975]|uniref:hypothetical protein n=1 Tax=Maritimibacter sp. UBA3975 TaxID=1946833 RepID=UPI000C0B6C9C|nr:hypothetical protein [Maritimibacter sp. UBA3975]MAM60379.1 hypothetical protein [Maritimibacter sp.]|tara:strand:+ start:1746 stop:2162 length:417 start_codon:yes stop_codon:yes gene_type:complete